MSSRTKPSVVDAAGNPITQGAEVVVCSTFAGETREGRGVVRRFEGRTGTLDLDSADRDEFDYLTVWLEEKPGYGLSSRHAPMNSHAEPDVYRCSELTVEQDGDRS